MLSLCCVKPVLCVAVIHDTVTSAQMKLSDIADTLQGDWVVLAQQLDVRMTDINHIKADYNTVSDQALAMLVLWVDKKKEKATGLSAITLVQHISNVYIVPYSFVTILILLHCVQSFVLLLHYSLLSYIYIAPMNPSQWRFNVKFGEINVYINKNILKKKALNFESGKKAINKMEYNCAVF